MATITHRGHQRNARGYSAGEIVEAGLTIQDVMKHKIRMDPRRKTTYKENVAELKAKKK